MIFFFNFFSFSFLCHVSVMFFAKILYIFLCSPKLLVNFLLNELFAFNFGMQWLSIIFQFLLHRKISLLLLNIKKFFAWLLFFCLLNFLLLYTAMFIKVHQMFDYFFIQQFYNNVPKKKKKQQKISSSLLCLMFALCIMYIKTNFTSLLNFSF